MCHIQMALSSEILHKSVTFCLELSLPSRLSSQTASQILCSDSKASKPLVLEVNQERICKEREHGQTLYT